MYKDVIMFFSQWGPGIFILAGLFLFFKKLISFIPLFVGLIESHQKKMDKQTEVLEGLKETFKDTNSQHSLEHKEILVLLRYISQKLKILEENSGKE